MNVNGIIFVSIIGNIVSGALALRLTTILVPRFAIVGENVKLSCDFDLEDDELDSVTWYKDNVAFFKFKPGPLIQILERRGIKIDKKESTQNTVVLKDVTLYSSGTYKCKVASTSLYSNRKETARDMIVVQLPTKVEIVPLKDSYTVGENVIATCHSYASNPTASISWEINDKRISSPQHESGNTSTDILNDFLKGIQDRVDVFGGSGSDKFFSRKDSSLQIKFRVSEKYLTDGIKLGCLAHIGDPYVPASQEIGVTRSTANGNNFTKFIGYIHLPFIFTFILKYV